MSRGLSPSDRRGRRRDGALRFGPGHERGIGANAPAAGRRRTADPAGRQWWLLARAKINHSQLDTNRKGHLVVAVLVSFRVPGFFLGMYESDLSGNPSFSRGAFERSAG
jgi:hypothetical protein